MTPEVGLATVSGNPITVTDAKGESAIELTAAINYTQSGSGDSSPTNIRPITGLSALELSQSGADTTNPTTTTIQLGQTVYGGTLDVVSGVLTIDRILLSRAVADMDNTENYPGWRNVTELENAEGITIGTQGHAIDVKGNVGTRYAYNTSGTSRVIFLPQAYYDGLKQSDWQTNYPDLVVQFILPLATPTTVQLTPQEITLLAGTNNIWANTDENLTLTYKYERFQSS